jgi:hypothetical protein
VNPHFIEVKQAIASWLIDRDIMWPLAENAPWWMLTNYPDERDVFSWLDGSLVLGYILGASVVLGAALAMLLAGASRLAGAWQKQKFYHLSQAFIPLAGCGVFLGLSALTITLLKNESLPVSWANTVRLCMLAGASLWSLWLAVRILRAQTSSVARQAGAFILFACAVGLIDYMWWLRFWVW